MTPTVTPAVERVSIPAGLTFYPHQAECIAAWRDGARRMIWRHHRQSGKGLAGLGLVAMAAFERPGTYAVVSPTDTLSRENFWDARDPDTGRCYLALIPPPLLVDRNEAEMALIMATAKAGQTSRIVFRSADDPDRLRGPAYAGVLLDEFSTMPSAEPLDVVRIPLERAQGWLLITSTPKGLNHFHKVWLNAEGAGGWYLSTKTIEQTVRHDGTPIFPLSVVEQERAEGQREEWIQQEYFVAFTAALTGSIYGADLTRAQQDGRICDIPHDPGMLTQVGFDLGLTGGAVIAQASPRGTWINVLWAVKWQHKYFHEQIALIRATPFAVGHWIGPHDLEQGSATTSETSLIVAQRLGVSFTVVPKVAYVQQRIDLVGRKFPMCRFDARGTAPLLEDLQGYHRRWDPRLKDFGREPVHDEHSHLCDAFGCLLSGWKELSRHSKGWKPGPSKVDFDALNPWRHTRRP